MDDSSSEMSQRLSTRPEPVLEQAAPPTGWPARSSAAARLVVSPWIVLAGDLAALLGAFLLAYTVRYVWRLGPELNEFQLAPLDSYWIVAGLFIGMTVASFYVLGRYQRRRTVSLFDDGVRIGVGVLIGTAAVITVFFAARPLFFSRLMFLYLGVLGAGLASIWLLARRLALDAVRRAGFDNQRVLVVGSGVVAKFLMQQLSASPSAGNRVVGYLETGPEAAEAGFGRFQRLGDLRDLEAIIQTRAIDEVYVALPSSDQQGLGRVLERCRTHGVRFRVAPDLLEAQFGRMEIHPLAGIPLITLSDDQIGGFKYIQKRLLDILVSLTGLAVTGPLWIVIALAVKLDSPGPVLFKHTRIGKGGCRFTLLKFRSMVADAEVRKSELFDGDEHPMLFKVPDDARRTRVGRVLRRFSLDELPQLLNVLAGSMSLVGPRAQVPAEVEQYDDWARHRLRVLPGLTGLWQVSGRSDVAFVEMVMLDTYYVTHWSLGLDLKILLMTIPVVVGGRGAY